MHDILFLKAIVFSQEEYHQDQLQHKKQSISLFSSERGDISKISPIRLGIPLKYQIWDTGAANSICPIRSRRTFERVTSTPQRSQTTPL